MIVAALGAVLVLGAAMTRADEVPPENPAAAHMCWDRTDRLRTLVNLIELKEENIQLKEDSAELKAENA